MESEVTVVFNASMVISCVLARSPHPKYSHIDAQNSRSAENVQNSGEAVEVNQTLRRDMLSGIPESVEYVQKSDDSRNSAIRIAYRNSLRPSSLPEPRHSSLKFSTFVSVFR